MDFIVYAKFNIIQIMRVCAEPCAVWFHGLALLRFQEYRQPEQFSRTSSRDCSRLFFICTVLYTPFGARSARGSVPAGPATPPFCTLVPARSACLMNPRRGKQKIREWVKAGE